MEILHRYEMGIMGHLPTFVWTSDLYESLRRASLQENFEALEAAARIRNRKNGASPWFHHRYGEIPYR